MMYIIYKVCKKDKPTQGAKIVSSKYDTYNNPLTGRYAGKEMSRIWSPQYKHSTWRRLWLALA